MLVVTSVLVPADVGVGLGFGLFGVLSIIRLRSDSITHEEIAYYFVALALGLLGGILTTPVWLDPALSAVLVGVMYLVDHPRLFRRVRRQVITLDAAYVEEQQLRAALHRLLGTEAHYIAVLDVDLVRDVTRVDVRYRAAR